MKGPRARRLFRAMPFILLLAGCAVTEPALVPTDVMALPDAGSGHYGKAAVYVDMTAVPEDQRSPDLVWETEAGLRDRGFEVLGHNAFVEFLKTRAVPPTGIAGAGTLKAARERLGRSALVIVRVSGFSARAKTERRDKVVTPGVPGVREAPMTFLEHGLHDWREWVIDLSLTFEMMDTATATKVWACSLACSGFPFEGKLQAFFKKAVGRCLETLPRRSARIGPGPARVE